MKKCLLGIFMLTLSICLFSSKTFAQQAPGTWGIDFPEVYSTPPAYVKSVKRNNGNGTTANGLGEVRLSVAKSFTGEIRLTDVRSQDNPDVSLNAVGFVTYGTHEKGYLSFELTTNILPAKKAIFYFQSSDGTSFSIGE